MYSRSLFVLVLLCSLFPFICYGAQVRFGAAPAWVVPIAIYDKVPNLRDVNDGYYIQLFEQEVSVPADEVYTHTIKHIVSDAGIQAASNLSFNFNPAYEQLIVHQITVWREGQKLDKMQRDAFKVLANEQELSRFIYNGNYTAYLILNDIRKGDKIEYAYTIKGSNPIFERKCVTYFTFQASDPITQLHYCLISPAARPLNFKYFNTAPKPVVTTAANNVLYEWKMQDVKGLKYTDNSPSWFSPFPYVEVSEYRNWGEVAEWAHKINKPDDKLGGVLGKRIAGLQAKYGADSAGFFREIVELVQNEVRYMGVELGQYSHKANSPAKVYEQRYGDCKDKSLLLVSMLHTAGIAAEMALVNTGSKEKVAEELPSSSAFNHAIVVAHLQGKDIWVDPTDACQGGTGTSFYFPNYGKALVLAPDTKGLTYIPEQESGDVNYTEEYVIVNEAKPVELTVYTTYRASKADEIRNTLANMSRADIDKNYLNYYNKLYPRIESTDTVTINDDKEANTIETIEHYSIADFFEYSATNKNYSVGFYARMIKDMLPIVGTVREYPVALNYPYSLNYTIHVNVPINWEIEPVNEKISRTGYGYTYNVAAVGSKLSLSHNLTIYKDHIAPEDIAQYEKDYKKIVDDYLSYSFTYTPGADMTTARSGKNFWAIAGFILLMAGCAYAAMRIYKTPTTPGPFARQQPMAIGGWLILPVLGLAITGIKVLYFVFSSGFFSGAVWHAYDAHAMKVPFQILLGFELVYNTCMIAFNAFCLVLIFQKRDILPKYIRALYLTALAGVFIDTICSALLMPASPTDYKELVRSVVQVCIWVPYFSRADRVRETFIVPYTENNRTYPPKTAYTGENEGSGGDE